MSHGLQSNARLSIHAKIPEIGWLPLQLSGHIKNTDFYTAPIDGQTITHWLDCLKEISEWLSRSSLKYGLQWAESGLVVNYDPKHIAQYALAMRSDEEFAELIAREGYFFDRDINMEW